VSKTVKYLYDLNSKAKVIWIRFILTNCNMVQVLIKKAFKLQRPDDSSIRIYAYYENIDKK